MNRTDKLAYIADALTQINLSIQIEGEEVHVGPLIGWGALEITRLQRDKEPISKLLEGLEKAEVLAG